MYGPGAVSPIAPHPARPGAHPASGVLDGGARPTAIPDPLSGFSRPADRRLHVRLRAQSARRSTGGPGSLGPSPGGSPNPPLRPSKGAPASYRRHDRGAARSGAHRSVPGDPGNRHPEVVDLEDGAVAFAPNEAHPGRSGVSARGAEPLGEDGLQPARRKGRVPHYLDAEVAGAGGTVTGRGR
jgi:hypothetical protein